MLKPKILKIFLILTYIKKSQLILFISDKVYERALMEDETSAVANIRANQKRINYMIATRIQNLIKSKNKK